MTRHQPVAHTGKNLLVHLRMPGADRQCLHGTIRRRCVPPVVSLPRPRRNCWAVRLLLIERLDEYERTGVLRDVMQHAVHFVRGATHEQAFVISRRSSIS